MVMVFGVTGVLCSWQLVLMAFGVNGMLCYWYSVVFGVWKLMLMALKVLVQNAINTAYR